MDCLITSHNSLHEEQQAIPYLHQLYKCNKLQNIHHIHQLGNFFDSKNDIESIRQLSTLVSSHVDSWSPFSPNGNGGTQNILIAPDNQRGKIVKDEDNTEVAEISPTISGDNESRPNKPIHKEEKFVAADSTDIVETPAVATENLETYLEGDQTESDEKESATIETVQQHSQDSHTGATGNESRSEGKSSLPNDLSEVVVPETDMKSSPTLDLIETQTLIADEDLSIIQHAEIKLENDNDVSTNNTDNFAASKDISSKEVEALKNDSVETVTPLSTETIAEAGKGTLSQVEELHNNSLVAVSLDSNFSTLLLSESSSANIASTTPSNSTHIDDDSNGVPTTNTSAPAPTKTVPAMTATKAKPCPILNSYQSLAIAYIQREDYVNALKQYTKIIKKCPWVVEMYFARAQIYHYYLEDLASSKQDYYHVYDQLHPKVPTSAPISCNISSGMVTRNLWKLQEEFIDKIYPPNPTQAIEIIRHIHPAVYEPFITAPLPGQPYQVQETVESSEISLTERLYRSQWIVSICVEFHDYIAAIQEILQYFPIEILKSFDPTVHGFTASKHESILLEFLSIAFHAAAIDSQYFSAVEEFLKIAKDHEYLTSTQQIGEL